MNTRTITALDRAPANVCLSCPVGRRARKRRSGVAGRLVKRIEGYVSPFCRAYERVYGHTAHES